jgi:hypothetical protein
MSTTTTMTDDPKEKLRQVRDEMAKLSDEIRERELKHNRLAHSIRDLENLIARPTCQHRWSSPLEEDGVWSRLCYKCELHQITRRSRPVIVELPEFEEQRGL